MIFKKYNSIETINRKKTLNYIIETGNCDGEWVSTLKIHGANYSIFTDGENVKHGKRSGFIEGESFYGDYNFNYDENARSMHEWLNRGMDKVDILSIHGEIYGGLYNHPDVDRDKSAIRVQKEVQYIPHNDFIVFDIKVDNILLDHDYTVRLCETFGFNHVPVLARGKFHDLIKMDVVFDDPLGELMGFPKLEDNKAEGWVLKPVIPKFFGNGERIILKGKNSVFSENSGAKMRKPIKPVIELSELGNNLKEELLLYLNDNRLRNVLSHGDIEKVTQKDFGRLLGFFAKDAFTSFLKDHKPAWDTLENKEQVVIKKNLNRFAGDVIRPKFRDIIDGEF